MINVDWAISEGPILYLIGAAFLALLGTWALRRQEKAQKESSERRALHNAKDLTWMNWPDNQIHLLSDATLNNLRELYEVQQKILSSKSSSRLLQREKKLAHKIATDYEFFNNEPVIVATGDEELLREQAEFVILTDEISRCKAKIWLERDIYESGFPLREVVFSSEEMTSLDTYYEPEVRLAQLTKISRYLGKLEAYISNYQGDDERVSII